MVIKLTLPFSEVDLFKVSRSKYSLCLCTKSLIENIPSLIQLKILIFVMLRKNSLR